VAEKQNVLLFEIVSRLMSILTFSVVRSWLKHLVYIKWQYALPLVSNTQDFVSVCMANT